MATTADYVGKSCPYCGAIDSIETDEARGEAACTECATVIAMGLEENVATRWERDATFTDVDREDWRDGDYGGGGEMGRAKAKNAGLTREEAAAAAAGLLRRSTQSADSADLAKYERTRLHPSQSRALETLFRLSRRNDEGILQDAIGLAKRFVGYRRERSIRVEHQAEVAVACLMLAAELRGLPIPLSEIRVLDPSLKDVESRRNEVVEETGLRTEMAALEKKMVPNLMRYYIQLLQLPLVRYEQPCLALFQALRICEGKGDPRASELALLVVTEKVVIAVLLARTEASLRWPDKPPAPADPSLEPPPATQYSSFASSAHLQPQRVLKIMRVAEKALPLIVEEFNRLIVQPEFATTAVRKMGEAVDLSAVRTQPSSSSLSASATTTAAVTSEVKKEGESETITVGVKRERSHSATPPAPPAPQH